MFDGAVMWKSRNIPVDIRKTADYIRSVQKASGEIPWSYGGKTDPWDHVESAMGLTVGRYLKEAKNAYQWLADTQLSDGSWWANYNDEKVPENQYKDSNMTAYVAVGVYHYYLITGDLSFLKNMWPCVSKAMDYIVDLQGEDGQIYWAKTPNGHIDKLALLTGCSSMAMSLRYAILLSSVFKESHPNWENSYHKLINAILNKPHLFDQTKSVYSMDWYYPILCGVLRGQKAHQRIDKFWDKFVIPDWGVRCVSHQPWVTMAETAELIITLAAIGRYTLAETMLEWIKDKTHDNGAYWMGVTVPDQIIYTDEKTTWTGAAVLLAVDLLYGLTPANQLFSHRCFQPLEIQYN